MSAYFSYRNAMKTKGKRGAGGRQIKFITYDDGYVPQNTVTQTIRLVKEDKILATVGGLGTEPQQAVRPYLNANKVPQLSVGSGMCPESDPRASARLSPMVSRGTTKAPNGALALAHTDPTL